MKAINVNKAPVVLGGSATVTLPKPAWPVVDERDVERVARVVQSGVWSWTGPEEMAFCKEYARFVGTRHCVGLANGTVTLQCALQAVGVVPGDEVVVPALTWVATMQAALDIGADVVLADIDPETLCISPGAIEKALTRRTKAIVPVHLYGCMCDMDAIMKIARRRKLKVVEDGAGGIGDVGSFSFQQSKILTSGEGGAVTCNDEEIYRTIFALKQVGWMPDPAIPFQPGVAPKLVSGHRYCHNYRITEMQAALLRGGLARLTRQTRLRETIARRPPRPASDASGLLRDDLSFRSGPGRGSDAGALSQGLGGRRNPFQYDLPASLSQSPDESVRRDQSASVPRSGPDPRLRPSPSAPYGDGNGADRTAAGAPAFVEFAKKDSSDS